MRIASVGRVALRIASVVRVALRIASVAMVALRIPTSRTGFYSGVLLETRLTKLGATALRIPPTLPEVLAFLHLGTFLHRLDRLHRHRGCTAGAWSRVNLAERDKASRRDLRQNGYERTDYRRVRAHARGQTKNAAIKGTVWANHGNICHGQGYWNPRQSYIDTNAKTDFEKCAHDVSFILRIQAHME